MLVRIIHESKGENPDFNPKLPVDPETNCPTRIIPVGTEIEDPDAWYLCLSHFDEPIAAEPVDDEAKAAVAKALAHLKAKSRKKAKVEFPAVATTPRKKPAEKPTDPA